MLTRNFWTIFTPLVNRLNSFNTARRETVSAEPYRVGRTCHHPCEGLGHS